MLYVLLLNNNKNDIITIITIICYIILLSLCVLRLTGTSGPCDTFGNRCLAHNEEFELKNVEVCNTLNVCIT